MKLYHATRKSNLESIRAEGLDPNRSTGKEAVVWLHTASRRDWAILHIINRHKCEVSDTIVIEVSVPRSKLRRRWRGIWVTPITIKEFGRIRNASEFANSPKREKGSAVTPPTCKTSVTKL